MYSTFYIKDSESCTSRDLAAARSVLEGEWPSEANIDAWSLALEDEREIAAAAANAHRPPPTCEITVNREGLTRVCP